MVEAADRPQATSLPGLALESFQTSNDRRLQEGARINRCNQTTHGIFEVVVNTDALELFSPQR